MTSDILEITIRIDVFDTQTSATTPTQSRNGSNCNETILLTRRIPRTRVSASDEFKSHI